MVLRQNYKKTTPPIVTPPTTWGVAYDPVPVKVRVDFVLEDISEICEAKNEITMKLSTKLSWNESRATYHNLKDDESNNVLTEDEKKKLWFPKLVFQNSKDKYDTAREISKADFFITRLGDLSRSESNITEDIELFLGNENPVVMEKSKTMKIKCHFNFQPFPFDTQVMEFFHNICIHSKSEKVCGTAKKIAEKCVNPGVIFGPFGVILGHVGSFLGHFGSFWVNFGLFFGANFFGQKCISAIFITFASLLPRPSAYGRLTPPYIREILKIVTVY